MSRPDFVRRLSHRGLRAVDRSLELARLNVLVGPVGSGKSTALDAVALAALGFVPRVGRTADATARLMRGDETAAFATLTLGDRQLTGGITRDGDKLALVAQDSDGTGKPAETRKRVVADFGRDLDEAEQNLDVRALLRGSPAERRRYLDRLLAPGADQLAEVAALAFARLAYGAAAEKSLDRVPADAAGRLVVAGPAGPALVAALGELAPRLGSGVAAAIAWAKEQANQAKADARQKIAARAEIENRTLGAATAGATQADLREQREAAARDLATLAERLAAHKRDASARARWRTILEGLPGLRVTSRDDVARKAAALAALPELAPNVATPEADAKDAEAAALEQELAALAVPTLDRSGSAAQRAEAATIAQAIAAARRDLDDLAKRAPSVRSTFAEDIAVNGAKRELATAQGAPWRDVEAIADELEAMSGRDSEGPHQIVDRLRTLARKHGGDVEALALAVRAAEHAAFIAHDNAKRDEVALAAHNAEVERRNADLLSMGRARDRALETADNLDATAHAVKLRAYDEQRRNLVARAQAARHDAKSIRNALAATQRDRAAARDAALAALRIAERRDRELDAQEAEALAALGGLSASELDAPAVETEIRRLTDHVVALDERVAALRVAEARAAELRALTLAIETADTTATAYAAMVWALGVAGARDLARRSGPIVEKMRRFLSAAGVDREPYLRLTKDETDVGLIYRGYACTVDGALCGGETVLVLVALAYAVLALRAPRYRVMLIEAAELHGADRGRLLRGLEAVADDLDLVMVAGPDEYADERDARNFENAATGANPWRLLDLSFAPDPPEAAP